MANELLRDDVMSLWQDQKLKGVRMSLDEVRAHAETVGKRVRRRTVLGSLVAYFLIACFVVAFFILPNAIARTGACLCVLACAYLAHQLHKRREQAVSEQTTAITSIRAYRAELERQRDFHCGKWFWSRWLIFLPSYLIFIAGFASAHPELARMLWVIGAVTVASAIVAVPVQYKEAQWYQKRIDQLDALER